MPDFTGLQQARTNATKEQCRAHHASARGHGRAGALRRWHIVDSDNNFVNT
jgi:hypothetical protein